MSIKSTRNVFAVAGLMLFVASCASGPDIRANVNPQADFGNYRTFAFFDPLGTDRGEYSSIVSQTLKSAARRELEARGYRYEPSQPDLLVNFGARLEEKTQVTQTPTMGYGGYYGYRGGFYGGWPAYETNVSQYKEGTLNVDLVDPKRRELVWEGVAVGRVSKKTQEERVAAINSVMSEIFAEFPYAASP